MQMLRFFFPFRQKIPMKDFAAEVRASMDVQNFMSEAKLMLDLHESNVEAIQNKNIH
jgi:sodium borate transporter 11